MIDNKIHKLVYYADRCFLQVGTGITNALINARKAIDKTFAGEAEDVPILSTSVAYGVYMAVSSNLRLSTSPPKLEEVIDQSIIYDSVQI
ncbi:hypothetical protein U1Q18_015457 [Sarracenia purpurea var. burkii]